MSDAPPSPPWTEAERLAALGRYGILDTSSEPDFDDIVELAAAICDAPIAVINLVAEGRQWFKAEKGLGVRETPLDISFCAQAILRPGLTVIPDLQVDPRFAVNPLVVGEPRLRFYAGAPLETPEGLPLGTLCVLDHRPRELTERQGSALEVLARQAMAQIELRRALRFKGEGEARYRAVVESATDYAILTTDLGGVITGWNTGARNVFGWEPAEVEGRNARLIFTPEDAAAGCPEAEMERALADGRAEDERWHVRKNGTRFFASGLLMPLRDEAGAVRGFLKMLRDRTDQRRTEDSLKRFGLIVETMTEGVSLSDADGTIVYTNPAEDRMFGYAPGELLGRNVTVQNAYPPGENERVVAAVIEQLKARGSFEGEWLNRRKDGTSFTTASRITAIEVEGKPHWLCVQRDVTDEKRAQAALRDSEARFQAIANSIDQMVWSTRPDGFHDYFNQRWYEFTGAPEGSTNGEGWNGMFHPDDRPRARAAWRESLSTGEAYRIEYRLRHRSGDYRWVLGRAQAVRDGEGRITRWFGTCTDIEEIVKAREVLARSREDLERLIAERTRALTEAMAERERAEEQLRQAQKMEAVGQLTGGIAHDFNNLLTGIVGSLDLLKTRIAQGRTEAVGRYVEAAMSSAERAAALTHRLLAFARRQPLDPKPVNANRLVRGMEDLLRRTVGPSIAIEIALAEELPPTLCDANQLENALLNLVINARDAMPEGGRLLIATADAEHGAPDGPGSGRFVALSVGDTGSGMTPEVIAKAFDPFFTTKPIGQGTGLGLSQIYGFVKQSDGHVRIESEPERGTTVTLFLPRHLGRAEGDAPRPGAEGGDRRAGAGETVLVVEDEPVVRGLVLEVLRDLGYGALEASDGPAGLRLLRSPARLDLLVTDVGLPGLNGRQLAEAARELRPDLKVLFITGYAPDASVRDSFLGPGMDMVHKPFAVDALAAKIRAMLGRAT